MAAEAPTSSRESKAQLRQMFAIGAIVSVCGIALGLLIDWFPVQASGEAKDIDTLWDVLLIASVPVFVLTQTIVLYCVWKYRMKPGEELMDGPPIHGNTRLEVIWTAIPAIPAGAPVRLRLRRPARHREGGRDGHDERARRRRAVHVDLLLPRRGRRGGRLPAALPAGGHAVKFDVQSKDVIHDFWVPAFRQKIDAVPGITTSYRVTTIREGEYPVVCAELCGLGHSAMRQTAHVLPKQEFDTWLSDLRAKAAEAQ